MKRPKRLHRSRIEKINQPGRAVPDNQPVRYKKIYPSRDEEKQDENCNNNKNEE